MVTDTKSTIESRSFQVAEIRAPADGDGRTTTGHAAVFKELSAEMLGFREKIEPGAFAESIEQNDVRALWNHDAGDVLGRARSGTLRLTEDELGLAFEVDVAETQVGSDALVSVRRGDVDDMSFGFVAIEDEWTQESGETVPTRTLEKVRLLDVSPVTLPCVPTNRRSGAVPGRMAGGTGTHPTQRSHHTDAAAGVGRGRAPTKDGDFSSCPLWSANAAWLDAHHRRHHARRLTAGIDGIRCRLPGPLSGGGRANVSAKRVCDHVRGARGASRGSPSEVLVLSSVSVALASALAARVSISGPPPKPKPTRRLSE